MRTRLMAVVLGCGLLVVGGSARAQDGSDEAGGVNVDTISKQAAKQDQNGNEFGNVLHESLPLRACHRVKIRLALSLIIYLRRAANDTWSVPALYRKDLVGVSNFNT